MALVIPAIAAGVQAAYGIYRGIRADRALKELQKQRMPQLMDAAGPLQQNLAMAQRQYTQGLAPQTRALALGTMASQMAAQRRTATDLAGGQLGTALGRIGAFNTNQMGLNLGAQNQQARERGMAQTMSANAQLSGLQQSDIRENIRQRLMMEQAYGQARQQAGQDVIGAIGGFGMAALNNDQFNKMMTTFGGGGGKNDVPDVSAPKSLMGQQTSQNPWFMQFRPFQLPGATPGAYNFAPPRMTPRNFLDPTTYQTQYGWASE